MLQNNDYLKNDFDVHEPWLFQDWDDFISLSSIIRLGSTCEIKFVLFVDIKYKKICKALLIASMLNG